MNAIVLEVHNGIASVLKEDGTFDKIKRNCAVGERIELQSNSLIINFANAKAKLQSKATRWVAAAMASIMMLGGSGLYSYNYAFAYSYVAVNSGDYSVECVLNRKNEIIELNPIGDASSEFVGKLEDRAPKTVREVIDAASQINSYSTDAEGNSLVANVVAISRGESQLQSLEENMSMLNEQDYYINMYSKVAENPQREFRNMAWDAIGNNLFAENIEVPHAEATLPENTTPTT